MCRLFGIHSLSKTKVHQALIAAENALAVQSKAHRDGWGIGYYLYGMPHIVKSPKSAQTDEDFSALALSLNSPTVIAHVRQATQGSLSLLNCHPFQYGPWVMAHNGTCPAFHVIRAELLEGLDIEFRAHVFGTTDSEVIFALLLNELKKRGVLDNPSAPIRDVAASIRMVIDRIERVYQSHAIADVPSLNVLLSNGQSLIAFRSGRTLHYSVAQGSASTKEGEPVNHLLICSEPLNKELVWHSFAERQIIAVDREMRLFCDL